MNQRKQENPKKKTCFHFNVIHLLDSYQFEALFYLVDFDDRGTKVNKVIITLIKA